MIAPNVLEPSPRHMRQHRRPTPFTPREVSGWFDDESGELTWDGVAYRE